MALTYDTHEEAMRTARDLKAQGRNNMVIREGNKFKIVFLTGFDTQEEPPRFEHIEKAFEPEDVSREELEPTREEVEEGRKERAEYLRKKKAEANAVNKENAKILARLKVEKIDPEVEKLKKAGFTSAKSVPVYDEKHNVVDYEIVTGENESSLSGKKSKEKLKKEAGQTFATTSTNMRSKLMRKTAIVALPERMSNEDVGKSLLVQETEMPKIVKENEGFEGGNLGEKLRWEPSVPRIEP